LWISNYLKHGNVELKKGRPRKDSSQDEMERLKAENAYLKLLIEKVLEEREVKKNKS
jgi:hypothetical protein